MPGAMRKPRQPRGVAGGKRNQPDKVQRQQAARSADKRVNLALVSVQEHQSALEARIAGEQAAAAEIERQQIERLSIERRLNARKRADEAEAKRQNWTLGQARDLVRQGYSVEHTVKRTGWPREMLDDVTFDEW